MVNDHMMAILANRREALGLSALEVQAARRVSLSNYGNVGRKTAIWTHHRQEALGLSVLEVQAPLDDWPSWPSRRVARLPVELLSFPSSPSPPPSVTLHFSGVPSSDSTRQVFLYRLVSTNRYFSVQNDYAYLFRHHPTHQPEHHPGGAC